MPKTVVAGNWKMNKTLAEAQELAREVAHTLGKAAGNAEVVLCPPAIALAAVRDAVQGSGIKVGAQNMYHEESGAFTGEISPLMLQGVCQYVILGHSERRQLFGETDEMVNLKVKSAFQHGLNPILCVGESLAQRESGQAPAFVEQQVRAGLAGIEDITGLAVAYEPIWAIGTGRAATPEIAAEIMGDTILETLQSLFGAAGREVPLLYGGSANPGNVAGFAAQGCIHGALVGGASLQGQQFVEIVQQAAAAKSAG
jgi:triosephosphate isomerase (TIM)